MIYKIGSTAYSTVCRETSTKLGPVVVKTPTQIIYLRHHLHQRFDLHNLYTIITIITLRMRRLKNPSKITPSLSIPSPTIFTINLQHHITINR